uniref:Similar to Os11g0123400 n=1 Tax=Arundo donax TaxID=35708 RepID=A0A0A9GSU7_ARUDO
MATGPARWSASTEAPSTMPPTTHAANVRARQPLLPASMETEGMEGHREECDCVVCVREWGGI